MRADISNATCCSRTCWVCAPGGLFLAAFLKTRRQPALRVFDNDLTDFSERPRVNHFTRLFHQRITGVIMGQAVEQTGVVNEI